MLYNCTLTSLKTYVCNKKIFNIKNQVKLNFTPYAAVAQLDRAIAS